MSFNKLPSQQNIKKFLDYDSETGLFVWKYRDKLKNYNTRWAGSIAGAITDNGYIKISLNKKRYRAHRLAWVYMYGDVLSSSVEVDHRNGKRADNRIDNLRLATKFQNQANSKPKGGKLPKGVEKNRSKFTSRIMKNGKRIVIGTFDTPEEASYFYNYAAQYYHGEFARVG